MTITQEQIAAMVKRWRDYGDDPQDVSMGEWAEWSHKTADMLEQLAAENARLREEIKRRKPQWSMDSSMKGWEK